MTFLKQWSVVSSHDQSCQQYNAADSFPLDVPVDINLITAAYLPEESIPSTAQVFKQTRLTFGSQTKVCF